MTWRGPSAKNKRFQPIAERENSKMKLRRYNLTLKGEEDEESEIVRFLRRLLYMIEKAEMVVGAYVQKYVNSTRAFDD
jgi:hypothetical protein